MRKTFLIILSVLFINLVSKGQSVCPIFYKILDTISESQKVLKYYNLTNIENDSSILNSINGSNSRVGHFNYRYFISNKIQDLKPIEMQSWLADLLRIKIKKNTKFKTLRIKEICNDTINLNYISINQNSKKEYDTSKILADSMIRQIDIKISFSNFLLTKDNKKLFCYIKYEVSKRLFVYAFMFKKVRNRWNIAKVETQVL